MEILTKVLAFLLSIFVTLVPYGGLAECGIVAKEDDCLFNMEIISDIHIEANWPFRTGFLKQALRSFKNAKTPVDALVVPGDLTNYGDEASLAKFYNTIKEYSPCPVVAVAGNHDIGHVGDRNKTDITRDEARQNVIDYYNDYSGQNTENNYYAIEINGYKFITFGDEVNGYEIKDGEKVPHEGGKWDGITMTEEELEFIDNELKNREDDSKPCFVVSHWALDGMNGEDMIWDGSGIDREQYDVQSILEKYKNVYYISGHMHGGVRAKAVGEKYNIPMAQKVNGVTYISLPSFGIVNMYGLTYSGTGAQLEVYEDKVLFRPKNYLTGTWYTNAEYSFELD